MKLILQNYRCYQGERIFTFSNPITFLIGPSGIGKTTLLHAILFALYGKGKNCASLECPDPYKVQIEEDDWIIQRSRNNLVLETTDGSFSGAMAQYHIDQRYGRHFFTYSQRVDAHFLEWAPRDQLELFEAILFEGEVNIKELKEKFMAAKRALDASQKEWAMKREMTMGFLRKLGTVQPTNLPEMDARTARHRLHFLQQRLRLKAQYQQLVHRLQQEVRQRQPTATKSPASIPYSKEQLITHIERQKTLEQMKWRQYMDRTVNDCIEEMDDYRVEEQVLMSAESYPCPHCETPLSFTHNKLVISSRANTQEIEHTLKEMGVETIAEGLTHVRHQIHLFEKYRNTREVIDRLLKDMLPIANAPELYQQWIVREQNAVREAEYQKKRQELLALQKGAQESNLHAWAHEAEVAELQERLGRTDLHELHVKEQAIRTEYEAQLADIETNAHQCASRQRGLARASALLAETEQQYLSDKVAAFVAAVNHLIEQVFPASWAPHIEMAIEGATNGARKLRISFDNDYTYDMFSSGEQARLNLCMLVAFANIQHYKLLLLDEFSRFLDRDTATHVLTMLRQNFSGQILCASHECAVENDVDVINLGKL